MAEPANSIDAAFKVTGIRDLLASSGLTALEERLITYLPQQRWFGAKSRIIERVEVLDAAELPGAKLPGPEFPGLDLPSAEVSGHEFPSHDAALVFLQLTYQDGGAGVYQLALALTSGEEAAKILASNPASIVATVLTPFGPAIVHDALSREEFRQAILSLLASNGELRARDSVLRGRSSSAFAAIRGDGPLPSRTGSAEQSNTSILYGGKLIMKLFRRLQPGENPDTEIGRFLTETAHFAQIAPFLGDITLSSGSGEPTTLAMLQGLVQNEGDGWQWTLDEISRYYEGVAALPLSHEASSAASFVTDGHAPAAVREHAGPYLNAAALLGRRTAEMHLALATSTDDPAFRAEPIAANDLAADAARIEAQLSHSLQALERGMARLSGSTAADAAHVLRRRDDLFSRARSLASATDAGFGQRTRIHGDYHLGQVLRSRGDFVILDFEGEPARTLAERRAKQSPLKDVAGMLRSFSYAANAGANAFAERRPDSLKNGQAENLERWAALWQEAVSTEFLSHYRKTIDAVNPGLIPPPAQAQLLLDAYLLEKALYELLYELDNRPTWVRTPLSGIRTLLQ